MSSGVQKPGPLGREPMKRDGAGKSYMEIEYFGKEDLLGKRMMNMI